MIAEKRDYKNVIIAFLLIMVIALAGVLVYFEFIKKDDKDDEPKPTATPLVTPEPTDEEETSTEEPEVTPTPTVTPTATPTGDFFEYSDRNYGLASSGVVTVKGYAEVKYKVLDCGVLGKCSEKEAVSVNDIVYLHIDEVNNEEFKKALKELGYEKKDIPIGCLKDGMISYRTAADEFGPEEYEGEEEDAYKYYAKSMLLNKDITKQLTSSSSKKPITLKLSKSKLTHYVSLTDQCDSVITSINIENN